MAGRDAYVNGVISDEEYLMLADVTEVNFVGAVDKDYGARWGNFNFDLWSDKECWVDCRFRKRDMLRIAAMLGLGDEVILPRPAYIHTSIVELFCLLCRRLALPCR
eukprot:TCONS_00047493-protein